MNGLAECIFAFDCPAGEPRFCRHTEAALLEIIEEVKGLARDTGHKYHIIGSETGFCFVRRPSGSSEAWIVVTPDGAVTFPKARPRQMKLPFDAPVEAVPVAG